MAAPNLEFFHGSFRQSLRDRVLPHIRDYSYMFEDETPARCCSYRYLSEKITGLLKKAKGVFVTAWEMGTSDPRKIIFSAKMGLALTLISLLAFFKLPGPELSNHYLWAILTVVVIFEFSIGATFSKGCNRGLGALSAGALALGMAEISEMTGNWAEVFNTASIFVVAFLGTYAKQYPTMKPYENGFRVFLLTYCYVLVSGYRTGQFMETAVSRLLMIALGGSIGLIVNTCIHPIWAGDDLHNLIVNNFVNVATSLEGCVNAYLNSVEYNTMPSMILIYEAVTEDPVCIGYKSAVQSTSQEDTLMGYAAWEPPHGPYRSFRYPWKMYVKVGGALRHCAFMVMALHGCILSEIQAPEGKRQAFRNELQRVGVEGAKVLRLIGQKLKKMERLNPIEDILQEIHQAAEQLQSKIDEKSYLLVNTDNWEIGNRSRDIETDGIGISNLDEEEDLISRNLAHESQSEAIFRPPTNWDHVGSSETVDQQPRTVIQKQPRNWDHVGSPCWNFMSSIMSLTPPEGEEEEEEEESRMYMRASALSLATFASLLIEFVARLENLVKTYDELCDIANFKESIIG